MPSNLGTRFKNKLCRMLISLSTFESSKHFSDFIGFHVRALFCLTLAFIAIVPTIDDWLAARETLSNFDPDRGRWEYIFQFGAMALFLALFAILFLRISGEIISFFVVRKWRRWGNLRRFFGMISSLVVIFFEVCAFAAIVYFVLLRIVAIVVLSDTERQALELRFCLFDEFVQENQIALGQPEREGCDELLAALRSRPSMQLDNDQ